jgi:hypothetical protein
MDSETSSTEAAVDTGTHVPATAAEADVDADRAALAGVDDVGA